MDLLYHKSQVDVKHNFEEKSGEFNDRYKKKMAGMQIGMGDGSGRRGGRDRMGEKDMPKPLDVWAKVKLSIEH